jgi:hypothetical protein
MAPSIKKELYLVIAVLISAMLVGTTYVQRWGGQAVFYQYTLSPSVMFACGLGLTNVHTPSAPVLEQFLTGHRAAMSCGDIPTSVVTAPLGYLHVQGPYLLYLLGWTWRIGGISWNALLPLYGVLFAISSAAFYGIFRLVVQPAWALLLTLVLVTSPMQLTNLPHLRDYAKAPFILILLLLAGALALRIVRPRTLALTAAAAGVLLSVGLGFRPDVLLTAPVLAGALIWSRPRTRPWLAKGVAAAAALTAFFAVGLLTQYLIGSNTAAVQGSRSPATFIQGMTGQFDTPLGVRSTIAAREFAYHDAMTFATVQSDYARKSGGQVIPNVSGDAMSGNWSDATSAYFRTEVLLFPADVLVRALGSLIRVLDFPFAAIMPAHVRGYSFYARQYASLPNTGITLPLLDPVWNVRGRVLSLFASCGLWILAIAVAGVAVSNAWNGLALAALAVYLAGVGAQQFDPRNVFYLEGLPLVLLSIAITRLAAGVSVLRRRSPSSTTGPSRAMVWTVARGVAIAAVPVIVAVAALTVVRHHQQDDWTQRIDSRYRRAAVTPLTFAREDLPGTPTPLVIVRPAGLPADDRRLQLKLSYDTLELATEYLRADLDTSACAQLPRTWRLRYLGDHQEGFSSELNLSSLLSGPRGQASLFFPVYFIKGKTWNLTFDGLVIRTDNDRCVPQISRVTSLQDLPVLPTLVLPPDWQSRPLYQTFIRQDWLVNPLGNLAALWLPATQFPLNQEIDGWTLLGYDVDGFEGANQPRIPIRLRWLAPGGSHPQATGQFIRRGGRQWEQRIQAESAGHPFGPTASVARAVIPRATRPVFHRLTLPPNVGSALIPVTPGTWYLQASWISAAEGAAYAGLQWYPNDRVAPLADYTRMPAWVHFARVTSAPEDAFSVREQFLGLWPEGVVALDDPVLLTLGPGSTSDSITGPPIGAR